jgi:hypothetical protein
MLGVSEAATAPQLSANASASGDKFSYHYLTQRPWCRAV